MFLACFSIYIPHTAIHNVTVLKKYNEIHIIRKIIDFKNNFGK